MNKNNGSGSLTEEFSRQLAGYTDAPDAKQLLIIESFDGNMVISSRNPQVIVLIDEPNLFTPDIYPDGFQHFVYGGIHHYTTDVKFKEDIQSGKPYKLPDDAPVTTTSQQKTEPTAPKDVVSKSSNSRDSLTYEVAGQEYQVSREVHTALQEASAETGMPLPIMQSVAARESSLQADAVNDKSQACGLFQFMTNYPFTLYEVVHNHGAKHGFEKEAEMIAWLPYELRNSKGEIYKSGTARQPVSEEAKQHLDELCLNPKFNALMQAEYKLPKIIPYTEWAGRDISPAEMAVMNNYGLAGAKLFMAQVWEDKKTGEDTLAVDFFKQHEKIFGNVSANVTTLKHPNGNYKTMRESYEGIGKFGGYGLVEIKENDSSIDLTSNSTP